MTIFAASRSTEIVADLPCLMATTSPSIVVRPVRNTPDTSFFGSNVVAANAVPTTDITVAAATSRSLLRPANTASSNPPSSTSVIAPLATR